MPFDSDYSSPQNRVHPWLVLDRKGYVNVAAYLFGLVGLVALPLLFHTPLAFVWLTGTVIAYACMLVTARWLLCDETTFASMVAEDGATQTAMAYLWPLTLGWVMVDLVTRR